MKIIYFLMLFTTSFCKNIDKQAVAHSNYTQIKHEGTNDSLKDSNYNIVKDSVNVDSILEKLYTLKKLKEVSKTCRFSVLVKEATNLNEDFEFDVGINKEYRFQTMYIFIYKKKDNAILFYDVAKDKYIEINKWDSDAPLE